MAAREPRNSCGKNAGFRGDKPANNGDNSWKLRRQNCLEIYTLGKSSVIMFRPFALLFVASAASVVLQPSRAHAEWWGSRGPVDFEECADSAEKATTKEARKFALSQCNAKFAGRRKPGGGYTYFDFMQNRSFDIAGPNPTPEEQKQIDEQYTAFLERERRSNIAAAFAAKQLQQATFRSEAEKARVETASAEKATLEKAPVEKVPVPVQAPNKPQAAAGDPKSRAKTANCAEHSFSCEWPRLSESIKDLKKALFGPPPNKAKRS
jgi:hypothetical protein